MKNLLTIIALMVCTGALLSQGTLQFNQVKLVGTIETVPTGAVWKINGVLPSARLTTSAVGYSGSVSTATTNHIISVNGTNVYYATGDAIGSIYGNGQTSYATTAANISASDIWLPQSTTLAAGTGVYRVSVTEFLVQ